jgi:hypothetical protein
MTDADDMLAYKRSEIQDVLDAGPAADEDWFRLKVFGAAASKHLNITRGQLETIRDILGSAPSTPTPGVYVKDNNRMRVSAEGLIGNNDGTFATFPSVAEAVAYLIDAGYVFESQ